MKNASYNQSIALLSLLFSANLIVGCGEGGKSVSMRDSANPAPADTVQPGEKSKTPESTPTPSPKKSSGEDVVPTPFPTTSPNPNPKPTVTPSPTPVQVKAGPVARFICEGETKNARSFNTLSGDAISSYQMPSLVPYINGQPLMYSKSPVPLQSNGEVVHFIMRGQEDAFAPWKIYKATGNILSSRANLSVLSSYPGFPPKGGYAYENLKLGRDILSANVKRSAYLYPANDGTYTWRSLAKDTSFKVPFNADTSFNPAFIGGDDYLRFDQEREGLGVLTQKFYHFDSKRSFSLPYPNNSQDSQLFGHVNGSKTVIYWVEGRPKAGWKVRSMTIGSPNSAKTLGTLPGNAEAIRLPMTFIDTPETTYLAYVEEEVGADNTGRTILKTSILRLLSVSNKAGTILNSSVIQYPDQLKNTALEAAAMYGGILGGVFYEPISGRLYSSVLSAGGLASYDINTKTWRTHGMIARTFGCFNPQWGIEVTHE